MDFMNTFRLALRALARNKMRSALTMLGIIIGVGAVIAVVSIGQGAQYLVQQGIAANSIGAPRIRQDPADRFQRNAGRPSTEPACGTGPLRRGDRERHQRVGWRGATVGLSFL